MKNVLNIKLHYYLFIIPFLFSCQSNTNKTLDTIWIGGKIINPRENYVVISHNRVLIDTVKLDKNDTFLYAIKKPETGIYFINHVEYQALFLEPGDSIMLYVNTIEFDESLSYTGRGAEKNNFLMELFLMNESLEAEMPKYLNDTPQHFNSRLDSILNHRKAFFNTFSLKNKTTPAFANIVKASLDYNNFSKKELYISANAKKALFDESINIPEYFYSHRKEIDFGNETLRNFYPYYRFLSFYVDNLAFEKYKLEAPFDRFSFTHTQHKIEILDSLIENESLKNSLLKNSVARYLVNAKNTIEQQTIAQLFKKYSTDIKDIEEVDKLVNATTKLSNGNILPNVMLLTANNTVKDLHSIIKKPSVLYFWSSQSTAHFRNIHNRANELRSKYPEIDFIGINVDKHFKKWLRIVNDSGYKTPFEFQLENFEDAELKLVINNFNKAIVINQEGYILDSNTNIFGVQLEQQLLGYLNQ